MNLYKQFETNADLEKTGVVIEYGNNSDGKVISFRVARAGGRNTAYLSYLENKLKPHRRMIQMDTMDQKLFENIVMDAFATTVVLGWEGVEDRKGNLLPYTPNNAMSLFNDLPDLYKDLQEQSTKVALFRNEVLEVDIKN